MGETEPAHFRCYAPIFAKNNWLVCIILGLIYLWIIAALILLTFGLIFLSPEGRCLISQYWFRITHCRTGNSDPGILL